jgi:2-oxo-3-hexenedioate decarboxylase
MTTSEANPAAWTVSSAARALLEREADRCDGGRLTDQWPGLDLETAYRVQDELLRQRVACGERLVGIKLGLTSVAKQKRMGIDSPLTAWLTDAMQVTVDAPITLEELIHPRIEPEIVFVLAERLEGPGVTARSALAAVETVHAGFEVIDSRFADFKFRLPDVVADNASSARFIINPTGHAPTDIDLALEECVLSVGGEVVDRATGAAVQGHPAEALALAANSLAERGLALEKGWIVLTGGLTDAVSLHRKPVSVTFDHLGTLSAVGT